MTNSSKTSLESLKEILEGMSFQEIKEFYSLWVKLEDIAIELYGNYDNNLPCISFFQLRKTELYLFFKWLQDHNGVITSLQKIDIEGILSSDVEEDGCEVLIDEWDSSAIGTILNGLYHQLYKIGDYSGIHDFDLASPNCLLYDFQEIKDSDYMSADLKDTIEGVLENWYSIESIESLDEYLTNDEQEEVEFENVELTFLGVLSSLKIGQYRKSSDNNEEMAFIDDVLSRFPTIWAYDSIQNFNKETNRWTDYTFNQIDYSYSCAMSTGPITLSLAYIIGKVIAYVLAERYFNNTTTKIEC